MWGEVRRIPLLRGSVNREERRVFEGFLSPAQRSRPPRDRSCSSPERSPDRPYQLAALTVRTATAPQITPIRTPRVASPLHHSTPRLTNSDTTINTPMDNSTVAANLEHILDSLAAYACLSLWCAQPSPMQSGYLSDRSASISLVLLLLAEGLAQFLLLFLWQVGRDDLEVVLPELVDNPVRGGGSAGQSEQRRGTFRHLLSHLLDEIVVYPNVGHRTRKCSHPSPDRRAEERYEEDQPEQETPEGSTHRSHAGRAGQLAGLRLLVALGPAEHSSVLEGDHLSLLQTLQSDEHSICSVGIVELQYR